MIPGQVYGTSKLEEYFFANMPNQKEKSAKI